MDRDGVVTSLEPGGRAPVGTARPEHAVNRPFFTLPIPGDGIPRELLHNLLSGGPPQELQTVADTGPGGQAAAWFCA